MLTPSVTLSFHQAPVGTLTEPEGITRLRRELAEKSRRLEETINNLDNLISPLDWLDAGDGLPGFGSWRFNRPVNRTVPNLKPSIVQPRSRNSPAPFFALSSLHVALFSSSFTDFKPWSIGQLRSIRKGDPLFFTLKDPPGTGAATCRYRCQRIVPLPRNKKNPGKIPTPRIQTSRDTTAPITTPDIIPRSRATS